MRARAHKDRSCARSLFWRDRDSVEFLQGRYRDFVFAPHSHDRDLISVVTGGALEIVEPRRQAIATSGQVVLFNHDRVHCGQGAHSEGWAILSVYLPPNVLNEIAREIGASSGGTIGFPKIVADDPALAKKLVALHTACDVRHDGLARDSRLLEIVTAVLIRHAGRPFHLPVVGAESRAVRTARDFLDSHFTQSVSLTELSQRCGVSRYWLIKAFKAALGVPPYAYLTNLRVRYAMALLREGSEIAEVSLACGFADQSHLTRTFKRSIGITPGQFRRNGPEADEGRAKHDSPRA